MQQEEVRKILAGELESIQTLEEEVRKAFLGYQMDNISQRREFYKHISLISSAILTLTPLIVENTLSPTSAYSGLILYFLTIILGFSYLRETLDMDANGFVELRQKYQEIAKEKKEIVRNFLTLPSLDHTKLKEYFHRLANSKGAARLKADIEESQQEAGNRKQNPSYFSELIVFLFTLASFLTLSSFFRFPLIPFYLIVILIFGLSFSSLSIFTEKYISKFAHFFCKKRNLPFI